MGESPDRSITLSGQNMRITMGRPVVFQSRHGYTAIFDTLGFKDFIAQDKNNKNVIRYIDAVGSAVEQCGLPAIAFSDTIVLTADGTGPEPLARIVKASSHFLGEMIRARIPVRGAIAYGEYVINNIVPNSAFLAGPPILDAYYFEQQQDWIGALLAPSAIETVRELNLLQTCDLTLRAPPGSYREQLEWKGYLQACDSVPFHEPPSPNLYKGLAVVPGGSDDIEKLCESLDRSIEALNWMQAMAPSPKEQRKYQATTQWLKPAQREWSAYLGQYQTRHGNE